MYNGFTSKPDFVLTDIFLPHCVGRRSWQAVGITWYHPIVSITIQSATRGRMRMLSQRLISPIPVPYYTYLPHPSENVLANVSYSINYHRLDTPQTLLSYHTRSRPCLNLLAIKPWGTCSIVIPIVPDCYPFRSASWRHQERHLSLAGQFFDEPSTIYSGRWWICVQSRGNISLTQTPWTTNHSPSCTPAAWVGCALFRDSGRCYI